MVAIIDSNRHASRRRLPGTHILSPALFSQLLSFRPYAALYQIVGVTEVYVLALCHRPSDALTNRSSTSQCFSRSSDASSPSATLVLLRVRARLKTYLFLIYPELPCLNVSTHKSAPAIIIQASAAFPENSLASFDRAIHDGSEGIESGNVFYQRVRRRAVTVATRRTCVG
jgi:hypothetical protein